MRAPAATYRIQLSRSTRFADVQRMVGYLFALGITDCYCSPILAAREGSAHGYDISDHGTINPELGDEHDLRELSGTLRARGMGLIVDFVPNHMGADTDANRWWRDVLENGPSSAYARFFDIDWRPAKLELHNKILLPILGAPYGDVLTRGELSLELRDGLLVVRYFDHLLPVDPKQIPRVLEYALRALTANRGAVPDVAEFRDIVGALASIPDYTSVTVGEALQRQDVRRDAQRRLSALVADSSAVRDHLNDAIRTFNGRRHDAASFDRLHALLDAQPYRLAYWRTALDEINYRRFFDVNDLVGLRVEDPTVFAAAHALLLDLVEERIVTGIRIDHPDGLFDPTAYFSGLRAAVRQRLGGDDVYVVAEKVLGRDERLRSSWEVHGTTGYNALAVLNGLFVHADGLADLRRSYKRLARFQQSGPDTVHDAKELMMRSALASELNMLAGELSRMAERDRRFRDFTFTALRRVLIQIVACFPVYRTYVSAEGADPADVAVVDAAIAEARRRDPLHEPSLFEFVRQCLLPVTPAASTSVSLTDRLLFARKFQQYTAPVAAKGMEDTAFYNDVLLLSTNEVGSDLERHARSVEEFHDENMRRLAEWPLEMTALSTHDTKRGEDARARIHVIAEFGDEWRQHVARWSSINRHAHTDVAGLIGPDRNDEWMFYQSLVGAWPAERSDALVPATADGELVERMRAFMHKAVKEAKRHTSWLYENVEYERSVDEFVQRVLTGPQARRFLSSFVPLARRLSWFGMVGSLSQVVLRLGAPGVPDIYQGSELWNLSLVDPDNRRPVDFALRCRLLTSIEPLLAEADPASLSRLLEAWPDGRVKLFTTTAALRLRRAEADLFLKGAYEPLSGDPTVDAHIVAFSRRHADREVVVVAPRLVATLQHGQARAPIGVDGWGRAMLLLPARLARARLRNIFTGELHQAVEQEKRAVLPLANVFGLWPVAMLVVQ